MSDGYNITDLYSVQKIETDDFLFEEFVKFSLFNLYLEITFELFKTDVDLLQKLFDA